MFSSMKKAADYFNVDYRSLIQHLDTKKAINKNGMYIYLFTKKLCLHDLNLLCFDKTFNITTLRLRRSL